VAISVALPLLLRLLLLPLLPVPKPAVADEFSYLLGADTFAHSRLTNPPHPLGPFFEAFHILVQPTYASMYPPGQALALALGQVTFGGAWWGVFLSVGLMCGAVCWLLQAFLPPRWSLAGGLSFALLFGVESYFMNSYWGGAVPALGGALLVGSVARLAVPRTRVRRPVLLALLAGVGVALLAGTRPWEGFCVALPCALALLAWLARGPEAVGTKLGSVVLPLLLVLVLAGAFLLRYNRRVTGDPFKPPYLLNLERYYTAPLFVWQSERPALVHQHEEMRRYYADWRRWESSLRAAGDSRNPLRVFLGWFHELKFCGGTVLAAILVAAFARGRRSRFLLLATAFVFAGLSVTLVQQLHYLAPAAGLLVAMQMQGLRVLGRLRLGGRRLAAFLPGVVLLAASIGLARNVVLTVRLEHAEQGRGFGERRAAVEARLSALPGRHLVLVQYGPDHVVHDEWVYNGADIDGSRVVFAHDMGPAENERLIRYFAGRVLWRFEPEERDRLTPHPGR